MPVVCSSPIWAPTDRRSFRASLVGRLSRHSLATMPARWVITIALFSISIPTMLGTLAPAVFASWIRDASEIVLSCLICASRIGFLYSFLTRCLTTTFQGPIVARDRSASAPLWRDVDVRLAVSMGHQPRQYATSE